jgi:hypothetical protein
MFFFLVVNNLDGANHRALSRHPPAFIASVEIYKV